MNFLDDAPIATLISIASIIVIVVAYFSDDIGLQDALIALGALLGGSGVLGVARAQSGKGVRR
jgi:hypothetical protein